MKKHILESPVKAFLYLPNSTEDLYCLIRDKVPNEKFIKIKEFETDLMDDVDDVEMLAKKARKDALRTHRINVVGICASICSESDKVGYVSLFTKRMIHTFTINLFGQSNEYNIEVEIAHAIWNCLGIACGSPKALDKLKEIEEDKLGNNLPDWLEYKKTLNLKN